MRKIILLGFCLLLSLGLDAQKKGDFYVGASGGASFTNSSAITFGAAAAVEVGYFVFKNWRLAASAGYSFQEVGTREESSIGHVLLLGPSVSYYVKLAKGLYYTPEVGGYYAMGWNVQQGVNVKVHGYEVGLSLFALEFRPSEKLGFRLSVAGITAGEMVTPANGSGNWMGVQNLDAVFNTSSSAGVLFYF